MPILYFRNFQLPLKGKKSALYKQIHILTELFFFPPVSYMAMIHDADIIELEACEHYMKRSYRNRCYIATAVGKHLCSIPLVKGKNSQMPIRDVRISYDWDWQSIFWKTISTAYNRSPFFEHYQDILMPYFTLKYPFLWDYNYDIFKTICNIAGVKGHVQLTESYDRQVLPGYTDIRNMIFPEKTSPFKQIAPYTQVFADRQPYIPDLSILDLIFCCGTATSYFLKTAGSVRQN